MVARYGIRLEHGGRRWSGGVASSRRRRRRRGRHRHVEQIIGFRQSVRRRDRVAKIITITKIRKKREGAGETTVGIPSTACTFHTHQKC